MVSNDKNFRMLFANMPDVLVSDTSLIRGMGSKAIWKELKEFWLKDVERYTRIYDAAIAAKEKAEDEVTEIVKRRSERIINKS